MLYILIALIFYTAALMIGTVANRAINSTVVTAIINTLSAIIPIFLIAPHIDKRLFTDGKHGLIMAVLAGICIAIFSLAINKSFQVNKVALVSPIVFGGAIFLTAILGYIFFKEKLSILHISGLILMGVGLLTIIYSAVSGK